MKRTLMILIASTGLTGAAGLPGWGAIQTAGAPSPTDAQGQQPGAATPLILASGYGEDDDDEDEHEGRRRRGHDDDHEDDDDDDDDEDCDDDEEDEDCRDGGRNPAPAGSTTPPQNGLFGTGAAPQVQVN